MKCEANGKVETIANFDDVNLNGAVELAKNAVHVDHASCVQFNFFSSPAEDSDCMSFTINDSFVNAVRKQIFADHGDVTDSPLAVPTLPNTHHVKRMSLFDTVSIIAVVIFVLSLVFSPTVRQFFGGLIVAFFCVIVLVGGVFAEEKNSSSSSENVATVRAIT